MPLKFKYQKREEIPAELLGHYAERDGAWQLDVDGDADKVLAHGHDALKTRLDEFRQNNVTLLKQLEEQRKKFEGIDPEEVRKLSEEKQRLEEERQIKAGEVEKVLETRVKGIKGEWDKQLAAVASERDTLNSRLMAIQIDQGVIASASKRGLRATAIPDITSRARNVFKLVNGVPTAFESDGQTVRVGKDGVAPLTLEDWVNTQAAEAPHLFESNAGGGAAGNPGGVGNGSVKNPWKAGSINVTEQMKMLRSDPQRAAQMQAAAGH
ncbi:MAG: hypothetical protein ACXWBP_10050 [Limisphaerales bacterium]